MLRKTVFILFAFFALRLASSCCQGVKYFDFTEMEVFHLTSTVAKDQNFSLELLPKNTTYMSSILPNFTFSTANATSCLEGYAGMKYPIEKIEIFSNADFNNDFSAGTNLANLFQTHKFEKDSRFEYVSLKDIGIVNFASESGLELLLTERPTSSQKHKFLIKILKSNQEKVILETQEITWE